MCLIIKRTTWVLTACILVIMLPSCNKSKEKDKSCLSVLMTDSRSGNKIVMIDLQGVEVTGKSGNQVKLYTNTGIYNLPDYPDRLNTLIASGDLDAGTISQIRLILGPGNTVMVDSVIYPLIIPDNMLSRLKIQIDQKMDPGVSYTILLDFDANQSVIVNGNSEYHLNPVIKPLDSDVSGFYNP